MVWSKTTTFLHNLQKLYGETRNGVIITDLWQNWLTTFTNLDLSPKGKEYRN